jgi:hypothetical protein
VFFGVGLPSKLPGHDDSTPAKSGNQTAIAEFFPEGFDSAISPAERSTHRPMPFRPLLEGIMATGNWQRALLLKMTMDLPDVVTLK